MANNAWIEPKTNWSGSNTEYFELQPDYQRIKYDIEYLKTILEELQNETINLLEMPIYLETEILTPSFYNNIVDNINTLYSYSYNENIYAIAMRKYDYNDDIASYKELNDIETNLSKLFNANISVVNFKQKVGYKKMGVMSLF